MDKKHKKRSPLIPAGVTVCIAGIAFFLYMHVSSAGYTIPGGIIPDTGSGRDAAAVTGAPPGPEELPADTLPALTPSPARDAAGIATPLLLPQPIEPDFLSYNAGAAGSDYITVRLDERDIHKGTLLLVNNSNYYEIPGDLDIVTIAGARTAPFKVSSNSMMLHSSVMEPLNDMMQGFADETGRTYMYIISAYRDFQSQRATLNYYIALEGRAAAEMRAKRPGHSEHHTGLAFDLATLVDGVRYQFTYFDATKWFERNSYKYGFILRYPGNKTSVTETIYEPWHYRYVGLPHSYVMHRNGWVLEEYIEKIKEYTYDEPMTVQYNDVDYEIFFTDRPDIPVPVRACYEISGNNTDGFIVTIYDRYDKLTNVSFE